MFQKNIDLKNFTTFGISAFAEEFAVFSTVEELIRLLDETEKPLTTAPSKFPYTGRGRCKWL